MWPFKTKVAAAKLAVKYSSVMLGMGQARWLSRSYRTLAEEGFQDNPIVYSCVTKIARAMASVDLHLYDRTRQGELRKIPKHPLLDLMYSPNPAWSGRQFMEKAATHYLVGGNAYVLGNNGSDAAPTELWVLPPNHMTVDTTSGSVLPLAYKYQPGQTIIYPVNQVTGRSEVLHLRTVNPLDEWYGLPPLAAAAYGVDIFNSGQEWNKSLLQNEGRPSGALQMRAGKDGTAPMLTDDQYVRLREEVDQTYSGSANAGRPLLLDSALEWVQMSLSSKDMDHKETMLTNARFIAACYGVPDQLLNIPGSATFANYEQAKAAFWADTVLPLLGSFLEDINRWLPALFGEKVFLWYDEEQIPALEPLRAEKSKRINNSEFLTINEKREAMGYEKHNDANADDILVNSKDIPLSKLGQLDPVLHPQLAETAKPEDKPTKSTD